MAFTYYIQNFKSQEFLKKLEESGIQSVTPEEIISEDLSPEDNLIVLCELDKDKDGNRVMRSEFYGIKLVQELRRERKFKGKALFVSFMPEDYLISKTPNGAVIGAYGHGFLQLPADAKEMRSAFKDIHELDDMALFDIIHHFSGMRQIINERLHALRSQLESKREIGEDEIALAKNAILNAYVMAGKDPGQILEELNGLNDKELTGQDLYKFLEDKIRSLFPAENGQAVDSSLKPTWDYWEVLWLDDDEPDESLLVEELKLRGITIHRAKTYEEAMEIWNRDLATLQKISVVITDYRLKDEEGNSRKKQGYHFLQDLAANHPEIAYMAYSHLPRKFLIESFKQFGVPVELFSKIDYPVNKPEAIKIIVDKVIQKGDEHWMMRNSQPHGEEWKTKIKEPYFKLKTSNEFITFEKNLSKLVRQNLDVFIEEFNSIKDERELWKLRFVDDLIIKTSSFPTSDSGKKERVKTILAARRFAIALYAFLNSPKSKNPLLSSDLFLDYIKVIMYNSNQEQTENNKELREKIDELLVNKKDEFINNVRKKKVLAAVLNRNALTFVKNGLSGLLPEEYVWLEFDSGLNIPILDENRHYWRDIMKLRKIIKDTFATSNFLHDTLVEDKLKYGKEEILFNDDYEPFVRSVDDIKNILSAIYNKLKPNSPNYSEQLSDFVHLTRNIKKYILFEQKKPAKIIKELVYFIDNLPPKKISQNKDIQHKDLLKNIDAEYSYYVAPWEFVLSSANRRIDPNYRKVFSIFKNIYLETKKGEGDEIINRLLSKYSEKGQIKRDIKTENFQNERGLLKIELIKCLKQDDAYKCFREYNEKYNKIYKQHIIEKSISDKWMLNMEDDEDLDEYYYN